MTRYPYRKRSVACIHPETYKYFIAPDAVKALWVTLEERYGTASRNEAFRTMEIAAEHFFLRAVLGGNPITLIRKRGCPLAEIEAFHELIGYSSPTPRTTNTMTTIDSNLHTPTAVLVTDSEQTIAEVSDRFCELFSCAREGLVGTSFEELINRKDRKGKGEYVTALSTYAEGYIDVKLVLDLGDAQQLTRVRACRAGESSWCYFVESLGLLEGDKYFELLLGQERWKAVMAPSDDGIAILDADNCLVEFNPSFLRLADIRSEHGVLLNEESLDGRNLFELLAGDDQFAPVRDLVELSRTKKKKKFRGIVVRGQRHLQLSTAAIHLPVKGFSGTAVTLHDVTAQKELEAASAEIARKNADITAILENLRQGVFTILPDGTVHEEYSAHLEEILNTEEIAGANALDLLFQHAEGSRGPRDAVESCLVCLGDEHLFYELNSHILPHEVSYDFGDRKAIVQLDWSAIVSSEDIVEKILVSLRDITELRRLEKERMEQEEKLGAIMTLTGMSPVTFMDFYADSMAMLESIEARVSASKPPAPDEIDEIFRNCHTIKGNSRIIGFNSVAEHAHEAEHYLGQLREDSEATWEGEKVLAHLADLRKALDFLRHVECDVLGRDTAVQSRLGEVVLDANTLEELLSSISQADSHIEQLQRLTEQLKVMTSCLLEDIAARAQEGLAATAEQLDKPVPAVEFYNSEDLRLSGAVVQPLHNMFVHMFNNSLDHGIEPAEEREKCGKSAAGRVSIAIRRCEDEAEILFQDDGKGLNIAALRAKYQAADKSDAEVAELILQSGVTSRDTATIVSGRGVGMDAVRRMARDFGGDVRIRLGDSPTSEEGYRPFSLVVQVPSRFVATANEA